MASFKVIPTENYTLILTVLSLLRLSWGLFFCIPLYNQFISYRGKAVPFSVVFFAAAAAAAKSLQSCPTLWDPIDGSPRGSPTPGILQARTLEWVAISSSNAWKWKVKVKSLSRVQLLVTPWTAAHQAPPCMGFSRQEYWSGVPLPSPVSSLEFIFKKWGIRTPKMPDVMEKRAQTVRSLRATAGLPLLPRRVPDRQLESHRYSWKE